MELTADRVDAVCPFLQGNHRRLAAVTTEGEDARFRIIEARRRAGRATPSCASRVEGCLQVCLFDFTPAGTPPAATWLHALQKAAAAEMVVPPGQRGGSRW